MPFICTESIVECSKSLQCSEEKNGILEEIQAVVEEEECKYKVNILTVKLGYVNWLHIHTSVINVTCTQEM